MVDRIPSGVKGLDDLLKGGVPERSVVLVTGPPGSGKSTLGLEMVGNILQRGGGAVYACTSDTPEGVVNRMRLHGFPAEDNKRLKIIDCFSWRYGRQSENAIRSLTDLNGLSLMVKSSLSELEGLREAVLVIDSLSDFLMYAEKNSVYKVLQIISGEVKKKKGRIGLVMLEEGMHEPDVTNTVSYIADGVIQMRTDGTKRLLRILKMTETSHTLEWVEYQIKGGAEIICVREFFK